MTKPTASTLPERVWRIVGEFGTLWKWTSIEEEVMWWEEYGRSATEYVPAQKLQALEEKLKVAEEALGKASKELPLIVSQIAKAKAEGFPQELVIPIAGAVAEIGRISSEALASLRKEQK